MNRYTDGFIKAVIVVGVIGIVSILVFGLKACTQGEAAILYSLSYHGQIRSEDQGSVVIATIFNLSVFILIAVLIGKAIVKKIKKNAIEVQKQTIEKISNDIKSKEITIDEIAKYKLRFARVNNLLNLIDYVNAGAQKDTKLILDDYLNSEFKNIRPNIIIGLDNQEKQQFPDNYAEFTVYCDTLDREIKELKDKKTSVEKCSNYHEFEKLMGKGYKRIIRIIISIFICVSIIGGTIAIVLYNSTSFTLSLAKEDCQKNFNIQNIIKDNTDITLSNVKISFENEQNVYIPSSSKKVEYKYNFKANCDDFSKYYTTNKYSKEAQELQSKMLEIYNALKPITYNYNHLNGWEVTFRFYGKFTIMDSNGHTYEYDHSLTSNDKWATVKVDETEISYN